MALPQSLTLSASKDEVRPGAHVTVGATASVPGSRVFFLAYDASVALQAGGAGSALTAERALAAVAPKESAGAGGHTWSSSQSCYPPTDIDGAALAVLTSLKTSTCDAHPSPPMMWENREEVDMVFDGQPQLMATTTAVTSPEASNEAGGGNGGSGLASITRVRSFFPETWIWLDAPSDNVTGIATLTNITAPDTITSWQFAAFATHPTGGLGVSDPATDSSLLRVFKPFFVSPNLPFSAIRGEDLVVQIGVFNYLDVELEVVVEMADSPGNYEIVSSMGRSATVNVAAKGTTSVAFLVRPTRLGDVAVLVSGRTAADVGYADAVRKTVRVEAEGFPMEDVINFVVNRDATSTDPDSVETIKITSPLPASGVVEGSVRAVLSVVGDLMGPSIKGLERLVRVPTGCGEQNMIGLAPNVYVLDYLTQVRQLTDAIGDRAASNILAWKLHMHQSRGSVKRSLSFPPCLPVPKSYT